MKQGRQTGAFPSVTVIDLVFTMYYWHERGKKKKVNDSSSKILTYLKFCPSSNQKTITPLPFPTNILEQKRPSEMHH